MTALNAKYFYPSIKLPCASHRLSISVVVVVSVLLTGCKLVVLMMCVIVQEMALKPSNIWLHQELPKGFILMWVFQSPFHLSQW